MKPQNPAHLWTYRGLWLFTFFLIFRPAEIAPALAGLGRLSYIIAALTLASWCYTQFWQEKRLTARTPEVDLVLALVVAALVTMPTGVNVSNSIATFSDIFIKAILMFLVMVNAVRSQPRLLGMIWLNIAAGAYVSWGALDAFRKGAFSDEGYRVRGALGATLNDPNDTALFLVTMIPLALVILLSTRNRATQIACVLAGSLMLAGVVITYSRGGFLALACAGLFLGWKMFRRAPMQTSIFAGLAVVACAFLLPPNYAMRLASIVDPDLDIRGSSSARQGLLARSVEVTAKNPVVGVGMGNFAQYSIRGQATHNAYTQVSAEMGIPAMVLYVAFIGACFVRLRGIEKETFGASFGQLQYQQVHFLSLGLQASLIGFMVGSFFLSVAYYWFVYYLVGYGVCLSRIYETGPGRIVGRFALREEKS